MVYPAARATLIRSSPATAPDPMEMRTPLLLTLKNNFESALSLRKLTGNLMTGTLTLTVDAQSVMHAEQAICILSS